MDENNIGKLTISKKYGSDVQLYHKANGDITFYACYLDFKRLDINGKPMRRRVKIGNQSEGITQSYVKTKRDEFATKARLGEVPTPIKNTRRNEMLTLQILADNYFANRVAKKQSSENDKNIKNDKSVFKNHLIQFAMRDITSIEDSEIVALKLEKLNLGLAESTINNALTLLISIFNYGITNKLIHDKPKIDKISGVDNERERFFDEDEILLIIERIKSNPVLSLFVKLSLCTGGRLETIRKIKIKDINLRTNSISLLDYKRKSAKKQDARYSGFFKNNVKTELTTIIKSKKPDDYLFSDPTGTLISKDYFQKNLQTLFNELFNQDLQPRDRKQRAVLHTLRHTFASHLAIRGVTMHKIQKLMNHSEQKMTERYAKLSPNFGLEEIEKLSFL